MIKQAIVEQVWSEENLSTGICIEADMNDVNIIDRDADHDVDKRR